MSGHLITRPAVLAECNRCGAITLKAVIGGLTTVTDTKPLTIGEEINAMLAGKATFDLTITGQQICLGWRDLTRIRAGRLHPVVAQHPCAAPSSRPLPPAPASILPDDPPF